MVTTARALRCLEKCSWITESRPSSRRHLRSQLHSNKVGKNLAHLVLPPTSSVVEDATPPASDALLILAHTTPQIGLLPVRRDGGLWRNSARRRRSCAAASPRAAPDSNTSRPPRSMGSCHHWAPTGHPVPSSSHCPRPPNPPHSRTETLLPQPILTLVLRLPGRFPLLGCYVSSSWLH